tara:strand:+ start:1030 stop:1971 length:942 start_codon:yes stop_codon:yes gene_type:complete
MRKKILITGVAGFIGSNLAKHLLKKNYQIYGIDNLSTGFKKNIPKAVKFYFKDLSKKNSLDSIKFNCDYIFHFAGQSSGEKSFEDPFRDISNNTLSTINIINYAKKKKVKKIIYASSMSVYGDSKTGYFNENSALRPKSFYGVSKKASEDYLKISGSKINYIILRLFNIYGPGQDLSNLKQGMVSIYLAQALKNKKIIVKGSKNRFRDFTSIDDLCLICERLISHKINNKVINIGTGKKTKIYELLSLIEKFTGKRKIIYEKETPGDQFGAVANNKLMKKILNFNEFLDMESQLQEFFSWAKKKYDKKNNFNR